MMVRRQVMLVGSSRGWRGPKVFSVFISDAGILEHGDVVIIPHGGSRNGGGEAKRFPHRLKHPKFGDVVDSNLEGGQSSFIGRRFLSWRYFIQLSASEATERWES